jgi:hypothetical protein
MQDVHLLMTIGRNGRTYSNNFTQWLNTIRVIKNSEVQRVDNTFIFKLFL